MELIIIFLIFGGGLLSAAIFMIIATKRADSLIRSLIYSSLAFGCLFAQRSCWQAASDFGRSTGSGGGNSGAGIVEVSLILWGVWTAMLIAGYFAARQLSKKSPTREDLTTKPNKTDLTDS